MGQLAAKIRKKYPGQYDDLDDETLEARTVSKYPQYRDMIETKPEVSADELINQAKSSLSKADELTTGKKPTAEPEKPKSAFKKAFDFATTPLVDAPSRFAESVANKIDQPSVDRSPIRARLEGFGAGAIEGVGDLISGETAPLSLALTVLGLAKPIRGALGSIGKALAKTDDVPEVFPESTTITIPERITTQPRPEGPWSSNVDVLPPMPKPKPTEDLVYDIAREKFNMGKDLPDISHSSSQIAAERIARTSNSTGKMKTKDVMQLDNIDDNPNHNPWAEEGIDQSRIDAIKDDIAKNGIKEPLKITVSRNSLGPYKGKYILDDGHHRLAVAKELGIEDVPVEITYPAGKGSWAKKSLLADKNLPGEQISFRDINKRMNELIDKGTAGTLTGDELVEAQKLNKIWRNHPEFGKSSPTAEFLGLQQDGSPLFNIIGGPRDKSTVTKATLDELGIAAPEVPIDAKPIRGEELRKIAMAKRSAAMDAKAKGFRGSEEPISTASDTGAPKTPKPKTPEQIEADAILAKSTGSNLRPPKPPQRGLVSSDQLDPKVPIEERKLAPQEQPSTLQQAYDLPRGMMSVDLPFMTSAAFRQSSPLAWTGNWFKAWGKAAGAFKEKEAFDAIMSNIKNSKYAKPRYEPVYDMKGNLTKYKEKPSYAEEVGLKLTDLKDLSDREEFLRSQWAEKIPGYGRYVRASNRAYTAFLNDLRINKFTQLMDEAGLGAGHDAGRDLVLGKQIADFVNSATGRGKLAINVPGREPINFEQNAKLLTNALFSPRLMASRIKFMNPFTYTQTPPQIRQEYLKGLGRTAGTWLGLAGLAEMAGAKVSKDITNADFGKIKIGDTRLDPGAGFQQYMVLLGRLANQGSTSSTTGKFTEYGEGYKPQTAIGQISDFGKSKLHPSLTALSKLVNATGGGGQFYVGDETLKLMLPMFTQDVVEAASKDPELAAVIGALSSMGIGTQTYGKDSFDKPTFSSGIEQLTGIEDLVIGR